LDTSRRDLRRRSSAGFGCFEVGPVVRRLEASEHSRTVPKKTLQLLRSSAFDRFPCPFLEILRQPEGQREGKLLLLRGVAVVGGPETGARLARPLSASSWPRIPFSRRRRARAPPAGCAPACLAPWGSTLDRCSLQKPGSPSRHPCEEEMFIFLRKPTACCDEVGPWCIILYTGI
jgi:hypothetical protein